MCRKSIASLCVLVFEAAVAGLAMADEPTRCIEEELRKRNLYFGDIDGRMSRELSVALKRYQERKNLAVTGTIDEETARSLNVAIVAEAHPGPSPPWPEVTVLRSDTAGEAVPQTGAALDQQPGSDQSAEAAAPPPPAESPGPNDNAQSVRATELVKAYLRDAEGSNVEAQLRYYAPRVKYFEHGMVDRQFVARDTGNYCQRWPKRHYDLIEPVVATPGPNGEMKVQFDIVFTVNNEKHSVSGRTRNYWTVRPGPGGDVKIVAIREERIRQ